MNQHIRTAAQRMTLLWFAVLSAPLLVGIAISMMVWLGNYSAPAELIPVDMLRMVAMGAMGLMLVLGRPMRNLLLSPEAIARRPVQGMSGQQDSQQQAATRTQASMFLLLGVMDFVAMIILALSLMQADAELALLNGVYSLILAVIVKPDFAVLITDTAKQLRHAG